MAAPWVDGQGPWNPFAGQQPGVTLQRPEEDPMALILAMMNQPAPDYNAYAQQQTAAAYGPLYQGIQNSSRQAQQRADANSKQLAAMYAALQQDIGNQAGAITGSYNDAIAGTNKAYTQGQQSIGNNYSQAMSDTSGLLKSLGLEAAVADPRISQFQNGQKAFLQSVMSANNQAAQNNLTTNKQSSLNFNTASRNAAGAAGAEARYNLAMQLTDRLNALENQRLQYQSQQMQASQQLASQLGQGYATNQTKLAEMMYNAMNNQANRENDLEKARISAGASSRSNMGPLMQAYSQAQQMLPSADQASQAVNLALQVGNGTQFHNAYQYIQAVRDVNRQQNLGIPEDALASVAATVWQQLNPQTLPSYMPYGQ